MQKVLAVLAAVLLSAGIAIGLGTAPALAGAPYSCTTSDPKGECPATGEYTSYPGFSTFAPYWNSDTSPNVGADEWGQKPGETQVLSANSPGDWQAVVTVPAGANPGHSVTTYPDANINMAWVPGTSANPALTTFGDITSSLADTVPQAAGNVGWQGYDLWLNDYGDEVMIQTNFVGNGPCTYVAVQQFGGQNGVPVQTWGLCDFGGPGGEKVWKLAPDGTQVGGSAIVSESSGSVDITAMTDWLINNGYMLSKTPAATTVTALSAGFEICNTPASGSTWSYSNLTFVNNTGGGGQQQAPAATTSAATSVADSGATLNGSVNPEGAATSYKFDYGTTSAYGSSTTAGDAGSGTAAVSESANLTGLSPGTTYHYRIEATNSAGTAYGSDQTFTTTSPVVQQPPAVTTDAATAISASGAVVNGSVNPEGAATSYQFDYGTSTAYGSNTPAASAGSGSSAVSESAQLSGLQAATTYHYRIEATNSAGTTYGPDQTFTTASAGGGGTGTVSYDATGPSASGQKCANCSSLGWTHTVSGSDTALLVGVGMGYGDDNGCVTSVTDNGVPMTSLARVHADNKTAGYEQVFGLAGVPDGSNAIVVKVTGCPWGGKPQELTGGSESFSGVSQTAPFSTAVTAYGSSGTAAVTVPSAAGNLVAGFTATGTKVNSASSPSVSRYIANQDTMTGAGNSAGATSPATGSNVVMKWAVTPDYWAAIGLQVQHD